jgi:D-alanine transfer protein
MKRIVLLYLLPFFISLYLVSVFAFHPAVKAALFPGKPIPNYLEIPPYIDNFRGHPYFEQNFLNPDRAANTIYVLGSSELSEGGYAIPYTFIPAHYKNIRVQGFGHAGNQCFSIFSQLLANSSRLNRANIVFIISPGWFEAKPSKGTSSEIFLEYNSEMYLKKILHNHTEEDQVFKVYAEKRVNDLYSEFNSPNLPLKLMSFEHNFSKSVLHKGMFALPMMADHYLISEKKKLVCDRSECPDPVYPDEKMKLVMKPANTVHINWDSLLSYSKNETLKKVTNNTLGIEDSYYTQFIGSKRGKIEPVKESINQELEDFKMLVQLAKAKHIHATFIISPLNPFYFQNQQAIQPTVDIIKNEISSSGFTYLDLLESDTAKYEKAILHDVMHLSDYGWYKADKYIIEQYKLDSVTIDHYTISTP